MKTKTINRLNENKKNFDGIKDGSKMENQYNGSSEHTIHNERHGQ